MEYNLIGKIIKPHGLKGEVKIKTDSHFIEERFKKGATVYMKRGSLYTSLEVLSHRSMKDYELVSFKGFNDVNQVIPLSGTDIYGVKDKSLLKDKGHFHSDLIGMKVYQFNEEKGEVLEIESHPQADYLVVRCKDDKEKLVPMLNNFIEKIDDENNIIYIYEIEGLL